MKRSTPTRRKRAFTLVEVLVTTVAGGLILGAAMTFLVSAANFTAYNQGKLMVNHDIRKFTSELSDNATYATQGLIYPTFTDRSKIVDQDESGDFLVLTFEDEDQPERYNKIIGYYRAATATNEGPVMKFSIEYETPQEGPIVDLLPALSTLGTHEEIIELSKGLSDGKLFFNFYDRSITIQGEILHNGSNLKRATNTYNFTVSPRG